MDKANMLLCIIRIAPQYQFPTVPDSSLTVSALQDEVILFLNLAI